MLDVSEDRIGGSRKCRVRDGSVVVCYMAMLLAMEVWAERVLEDYGRICSVRKTGRFDPRGCYRRISCDDCWMSEGSDRILIVIAGY